MTSDEVDGCYSKIVGLEDTLIHKKRGIKSVWVAKIQDEARWTFLTEKYDGNVKCDHHDPSKRQCKHKMLLRKSHAILNDEYDSDDVKDDELNSVVEKLTKKSQTKFRSPEVSKTLTIQLHGNFESISNMCLQGRFLQKLFRKIPCTISKNTYTKISTK